jgi:hypothetical protein
MKAGLVLVSVVSAIAGAALAQAPTAPAPTASSTPPPAAKPAAPGSTVSGVTVEALPHKTCAPKDKECIALVMAQVKELYPEQLKKFCYQQQMDVMREDMQASVNGWCDNPRYASSSMCHHYVPPVVKQVCASDAPAAKK